MKIDISSVLWGLVFLTVTFLALWMLSGLPITLLAISIVAPVAIIVIGIIGVVLAKVNRKSNRK